MTTAAVGVTMFTRPEADWNAVTISSPPMPANCPSGAMIAILCVRFQTDDRLASKIIFLSTVLSAITLPLMTYFLL